MDHDHDHARAHILFPYLYHGPEMKYALWTYHCIDPDICPCDDYYPYLDLYDGDHVEIGLDQNLISYL